MGDWCKHIARHRLIYKNMRIDFHPRTVNCSKMSRRSALISSSTYEASGKRIKDNLWELKRCLLLRYLQSWTSIDLTFLKCFNFSTKLTYPVK